MVKTTSNFNVVKEYFRFFLF